jgi:hypothetical protein
MSTDVEVPTPQELAIKALEWVEAHADDGKWNQQEWWVRQWNGEVWSDKPEIDCGTRGCWAGWLAHFDPLVQVQAGHGVEVVEEPGQPPMMRDYLSYAEYVQWRLGIDNEQEVRLTDGDNDLVTLRDRVTAYAKGEEF